MSLNRCAVLFKKIVSKSEEGKAVIFNVNGLYSWTNMAIFSWDDPFLKEYFGTPVLEQLVKPGEVRGLFPGYYKNIVLGLKREYSSDRFAAAPEEFMRNPVELNIPSTIIHAKYSDEQEGIGLQLKEPINQHRFVFLNELFYNYLMNRGNCSSLSFNPVQRFGAPIVCFKARNKFYGAIAPRHSYLDESILAEKLLEFTTAPSQT